MTGYLIDTSIFVATEQLRPLSTPPPGEARISVATLTELELGVRRASDSATRAVRTMTLAKAQRFLALPYDEAVSTRLAELLATARAERRRAGAMDAIIAATALAHGLSIWTQDDDFEVFATLTKDLLVHRG